MPAGGNVCASQRNTGMSYAKKPTPERKHEPKRRKCLRCKSPFMSEWPGERICGKCKATNAWRQGMPWSPGVNDRQRGIR